jgi:hypothetical protein
MVRFIVAAALVVFSVVGGFGGWFLGFLCGAFTGDAGIGEAAAQRNAVVYGAIGAIIGAAPFG